MTTDYSKEVADIHHEITTSQGRMNRLVERLISELEKRDNRISELEALVKVLRRHNMLYEPISQPAKASYVQPPQAVHPIVMNGVQIISQVDQMGVGDHLILKSATNSDAD